ncbi:hypothetical protein HYPBUDRAFT_239197 [Hyphopichia burtonii NRRL Y-1933]|uniref:Uncharacterized protein n=1 Tax=Hyphopichia burtonii NRRL Y-1933 TaxID=984485 RepID=A0A1E4RPQ6_9ASCO|nr:hypothetical protein HYPBUDRAFT_239197 [Hyphopichia burtonii NRRL Y-1933]ODV69191.1 hypothetical protein HYPBUDRAFT_239197 [Hyphopichia burtonii NRRL Y-1933]
MSSPLKYDTSHIEDKLSPIKLSQLNPYEKKSTPPLNSKPTPPSKLRNQIIEDDDNNTSPIKLNKHPHGLTSKQENRRNTIHHMPAITPVNQKSSNINHANTVNHINYLSPRLSKIQQLIDSQRKRAALTLNSTGRTLNSVNLDPINQSFDDYSSPTRPPQKRKFKQHQLHQQLDNSDKENEKLNSSPNRDQDTDEHINKISKLSTNANTTSDNKRNSNDTFFAKHDLVGQLSSNRSKSNIQDESDDDLDYAERSDDISQTMMPSKKQEITENVKESEEDHITPQRYTEPFAQSPQTNQQIRINEVYTNDENKQYKTNKEINLVEEVSSPLKDHERETSKLPGDESDDDIENEPTVNFLTSPNSKPYFSISYINKLQADHEQEVEELSNSIREKDEQLMSLSTDLFSTNSQFLKFDREIKELKQKNKKSIANEESLTIQLRQNEHELASLIKKIKVKENSIIKLETLIKNDQLKIEELNKSIEEKNQSYENLTSENRTLQNRIDEFEFNNKGHEFKLKSQQEEILAKDKEINILTEANLDYNTKVEKLLKEKEQLLTENGKFNTELLNSKNLIQDLEQEKDEINEKLLTANNNLKFQQDQINNLNNENLNNKTKYDDLVKEVEIYQNDLNKLENEYGSTNDELVNLNNLQKQNEDKIKQLTNALNDSNERNGELNEQLNSKMVEKGDLVTQLTDSQSKISKLIKTIEEKDDLIIADTKKIDELVQQLNELSNRSPSISPSKESLSKEEYLSLIEKIKLEHQQNLSDEMQKASDNLYRLYAKKHETKVNEIHDRHKKSMKTLNEEIWKKKSENESLLKKFENSEFEKEQLLKIIEEQNEKLEMASLPNGVSNSTTPASSRTQQRPISRRHLTPKKTSGGPTRKKFV